MIAKAKLTDDWIPLPPSLGLTWREGDDLSVEKVDEDTLLIVRKSRTPDKEPTHGSRAKRSR